MKSPRLPSTFALVTAAAAAGCAVPVQPARMSHEAPSTARELDAGERLARPRCNANWGLLWPGVGQLCHRKDTEGWVLAALTGAEVATAITTAAVHEGDSIEHPGVFLPLLGLQNLWLYSASDVIIDEHLALRRLYAPQDTLAELAYAPWNPEVLKRPDVWAGVLVATGLAVGLTLLTEDVGFRAPPDRPFGFHPLEAYPALGVIGAATFTHVAIGEEATFRGLVQSSIARRAGHTTGWLAGTLIFGAAHAPNALFFDEGDRVEYLLISLPFITAVGAWFGASYVWNDYSLAPPVAAHFWYDLLVSASVFFLHPDVDEIGATLTLPF